jgi:hypothetical protein
MLKKNSSLVVPVMLYACEVWGVHLLGKVKTFDSFKQKLIKTVSVIEKLHLKFCKRVLGVHSKASNAAVYAELGRAPLIVQVTKYYKPNIQRFIGRESC